METLLIILNVIVFAVCAMIVSQIVINFCIKFLNKIKKC